jgi:hypothetical protein
MDAALREFNQRLVAAYDSPEYRQLFAAYSAPSVSASYRRREAQGSEYRRYGPLAQPKTDSWDILTDEPLPGFAMVTDEDEEPDPDTATVAIQSEFAAVYFAGLEQRIATFHHLNRDLLSKIAEQKRLRRAAPAVSSPP